MAWLPFWNPWYWWPLWFWGRGRCWWFLPWFLTFALPTYLGYAPEAERRFLDYWREALERELEAVKNRLEELEKSGKT
ncbi:TPA: hypothetical protein EYP26_03655 [Candidatus Bathyarchaeota archaeon]|nr:hypothetical protein [Candidatus Bathyarchaeota archaeon]